MARQREKKMQDAMREVRKVTSATLLSVSRAAGEMLQDARNNGYVRAGPSSRPPDTLEVTRALPATPAFAAQGEGETPPRIHSPEQPDQFYRATAMPPQDQVSRSLSPDRFGSSSKYVKWVDARHLQESGLDSEAKLRQGQRDLQDAEWKIACATASAQNSTEITLDSPLVALRESQDSMREDRDSTQTLTPGRSPCSPEDVRLQGMREGSRERVAPSALPPTSGLPRALASGTLRQIGQRPATLSYNTLSYHPMSSGNTLQDLQAVNSTLRQQNSHIQQDLEEALRNASRLRHSSSLGKV